MTTPVFDQTPNGLMVIECQVCGNHFGDEQYMLGRCHGVPLRQRPATEEEQAQWQRYRAAKASILRKAAALGW